MQPRLFLALVFIAAVGQPALSQEGAPACETQQQLEQVLQSDGEFMPDDCRRLTVTPVEAEAGELCVLEFEARDPGVLETLQQAAAPSQWWIECGALTRR